MDSVPEPLRKIGGRYRLLSPLGKGGLGSVFLAEDCLDDRQVALKVLHSFTSERAELLRREAWSLCQLVHPNLCQVLDLGVAHELEERPPFFTTEYMPGSSPSASSWAELKSVWKGALSGLRCLHDHGLVHGDFKAANLVVDEHGEAKLLDLSSACRIGESRQKVFGTLSHMAPEVPGGVADPRADLYAVGVCLRALVVDPPPGVAKLITELTDVDPKKRPGTVGEVQARLGFSRAAVFSLPSLSRKLIGREQPSAAFEAWFADDGSGPPCFCLLGPSGVGKSRLVREFAWRCGQNAFVVHGRARHQAPLNRLLEHAVGKPVVGGLGTALDVLKQLSDRDKPTLFVLDDIDRLAQPQFELLQNLIRGAADTPRVRFLCAAQSLPPTHDAAIMVALRLRPLDERELRSWLPQRLSSAEISTVLAATGGNPGEVLALSQSLEFDDFAVGDLKRRVAETELSSFQVAQLKRLRGSSRDLLCVLCVNRGVLGYQDVLALGVDRHDISQLVAAGWLAPVGEGYRLARPADAQRLLSTFDIRRRLEIHQELRARYVGSFEDADGQRRSRLLGLIVHHCLGSGLVDESADWLTRYPELARDASAELIEVLGRFPYSAASNETCLKVADFLVEAGHARRALKGVAILLRGRPTEAVQAKARSLAARCYLATGGLSRSRAQFQRVDLAVLPDDEARGEVLDGWSLCWLREGNPREARRKAEAAADLRLSPGRRLSLDCTLAMALAYLGDEGALAAVLPRLERAEGNPRLTLRQRSALAFCAYRAGYPERAAEHYRLAQAVVERHRLDDLAAVAALNRATAAHQLGELREAYEAYARGLRIARAQALENTQVTLLANMAKLECDIGLFQEAIAHAEEAARLAGARQLVFLEATAQAVRGEALACMRDEEALPVLQLALESFEEQGARREVVEVRVQQLDAGRLLGQDLEPRRVEAVMELAEELGTDDVRALAYGACAASLKSTEALPCLERGLKLAQSTKQRLLIARLETRLVAVCASAGSPQLAQRYRQLAQRSWERLRLGLSQRAREAFDSHPERAALASTALPVSADVGMSKQLRRFVEINRRLNSNLTLDAVLKETMDAAIELSGAERGFLILRQAEGSALSVPVARNIDRERVGRSRLKFSHDIATQVLESGEPTLTVDARTDQRFADSRSVHALGLTSVLCVPIRSPREVLGAIYLDHRFRSGEFSRQDLEQMLVLADQAAIALENARLQDELRSHSAELESQRDRIAELLAGREHELEALKNSAQLTGSLSSGRSFGDVIGPSAAMQALFERLERIVATDLNVLLWGESGTGKEVLARAIHQQSPFSAGPFVALNCAAVPEALLEGELFGYAKGAFTGAVKDHAGMFRLAARGTLFLDEVGEMPLSMQVKLLRALQEREVRPLGGTESFPISARLLFATNRDLRVEVSEGRFREDLYYRIAVFDARVPALRERPEDIPPLCAHMLVELAERLGREVPKLSPPALRRLMAAEWPGNVRQLENALARACLSAQGELIRAQDIELPKAQERGERLRGARLKVAMVEALKVSGWNVSEAARSLAIPRPTFYRKLKQFGLKRPEA